MTSNAVYIEDDGTLVVKTINTSYEPIANEVLVAVTYSGINPADARHATDLGIRSTVAGYDFAGTVKATGPDCTKFKPGDIVAGTTPTEGIGRPSHFGAHQDELVCPQDSAFLVPSGLPLEVAAVIAVMVRTAADGLIYLLGFKFPGIASSGTVSDPSLLIWGAGSSRGYSAVQIAKLCGANPIIVTASPQHHSRLLELGATHCFDYQSPTVVEDIQALGENLCGPNGIRQGFDCIGLGLSGTERPEHLGPKTATCCGENAKIATLFPIPPFLCAWGQPERAAFLKPAFLGGETVLPTPVDLKRAALSMSVLEWVVKNYGEGNYVIPNIKIIKGGAKNALAAVLEVGKFGVGMCKVAILHPL